MASTQEPKRNFNDAGTSLSANCLGSTRRCSRSHSGTHQTSASGPACLRRVARLVVVAASTCAGLRPVERAVDDPREALALVGDDQRCPDHRHGPLAIRSVGLRQGDPAMLGLLDLVGVPLVVGIFPGQLDQGLQSPLEESRVAGVTIRKTIGSWPGLPSTASTVPPPVRSRSPLSQVVSSLPATKSTCGAELMVTIAL